MINVVISMLNSKSVVVMTANRYPISHSRSNSRIKDKMADIHCSSDCDHVSFWVPANRWNLSKCWQWHLNEPQANFSTTKGLLQVILRLVGWYCSLMKKAEARLFHSIKPTENTMVLKPLSNQWQLEDTGQKENRNSFSLRCNLLSVILGISICGHVLNYC